MGSPHPNSLKTFLRGQPQEFTIASKADTQLKETAT
jgi:hypothetical protein